MNNTEKPKLKSKPKFLKLIAVVEDHYVPITGEIKMKDGNWSSENVMTFKLDNDFMPFSSPEEVGEHFADFLIAVLETAKDRAK